MEEIAISKFKATCLAVLEKVKKTGQPILVTRFGHPVAQITPPAPAKRASKIWYWGGLCRNSWRYRGINYRYFRLGRLEQPG